jgi:hypothetical protein
MNIVLSRSDSQKQARRQDWRPATVVLFGAARVTMTLSGEARDSPDTIELYTARQLNTQLDLQGSSCGAGIRCASSVPVSQTS